MGSAREDSFWAGGPKGATAERSCRQTTMRHWHRCQRWVRRGISCPFELKYDHDDIDTSSDRVEFRSTAAEVARVPLGRGRPRASSVGVREPARVPKKAFAGSARVPVPARGVPGLNVTGIPAGERLGRVAGERIAEGIGVMPERWVPSEAELSNALRQTGLFERSEHSATAEDVVSQVAEEAASESIQEEALGVSIPPIVYALPLVGDLLRRSMSVMRKAPVQPRVPAQPRPVSRELGRVGGGSAQEGSRATARSPGSPTVTKRVGPKGGAAKGPPPRGAGGGGGFQIDMAGRMRRMLGQGR